MNECSPTFYKIIKKKSTDGFQSIPYVVALFSSMIWIYYATLKTNATLLITINVVGCVIETLYISIYIAYAPKNIKVFNLHPKIVDCFMNEERSQFWTNFVTQFWTNFVGFWVIALTTHYLAEGPTRAQILGWICLVISVSVFVAPLSIMVHNLKPNFLHMVELVEWCDSNKLDLIFLYAMQKTVIRTKSVEFMPFGLSFFLSLSAVMWFFYGLLKKDIYVAVSFFTPFNDSCTNHFQ